MYFKQFYLGCLAQASYLLGSEGEAVLVDPRRDVEEYLAEAERAGLRIRHVIETHLHADFVSGHDELRRRLGAEIWIGHRAQASFPHRAIRDGDELRLGAAKLLFWETPGHTPESVSVLVFDPATAVVPGMVLTGDTLFVGDVGRPDLASDAGLAPTQMAAELYDSLHGKLLRLPDEVLVYPGHGAGSLCGKNLSKDTFSTLGEQRRQNAALRPMTRREFVDLVTTDLPEVPRYFSHDAALNRRGAPALDEMHEPRPLDPDAVAASQAQGALILDVRDSAAFGASHLPGSLNVGLGGQFAAWAGALVEPQARLVLVTEDEQAVDEAAMRLARVGFEGEIDFLAGGVRAWEAAGRPVARLPQLSVDELAARIGSEGLQVVDVRRPAEYASGHVPGARSAPLDGLERRVAELDAHRPAAVICAGGYRSSAACSLLEARGFDCLNVVGGTAAWVAAGHPVERVSGHS